MVKLTTLGGEVSMFQFTPSGTVRDYASRGGVALDEHVTVSRNGKPAVPDTPVEENDLLIVAPKISNG